MAYYRTLKSGERKLIYTAKDKRHMAEKAKLYPYDNGISMFAPFGYSTTSKAETRAIKAMAHYNTLKELQKALKREKDIARVWQVSHHLAYQVHHRVHWQSGNPWPSKVLSGFEPGAYYHMNWADSQGNLKIEASATYYECGIAILNRIHEDIRRLELAMVYRQKHYVD